MSRKCVTMGRFCTQGVRRAFTLIELLVVVAILALLIAILIPSLGKARAQAKLTTCGTNLHSIGELLHVYASMNSTLPVGEYDTVTGSGTTYTRWYTLLQAAAGPGVNGTQSDAVSKLRRMYICPEVGGDAKIQYNNYQGTTQNIIQYACHPVLMPYVQSSAWAGTTPSPYKLERIRRSDIAVVFDTNLTMFEDIWRARADVAIASNLDFQELFNPLYRLTNPNPSKPISSSVNMTATSNYTPNADNPDASNVLYLDNIRFRHMKDTKTNVVMVDGHVENFTLNKSVLATNPAAPNVTNFLRRYIVVNAP